MKHFKFDKTKLNNPTMNKDYIANTYVMHCFKISMLVYTTTIILDLLDIFIVDKKLMLSGFIPSTIIYFLIVLATKIVPMSSSKLKYFILLGIVLVFTFMGVTITYHVVMPAVLPILYSTLYSSKKTMWYVYILTVISTIINVFVGYRYGLCDANMTLITIKSLDHYVSDGQFTLTTVNAHPEINLLLFFVLPRCLIYIAFMSICSNIYNVIKSSMEKAETVVQMEIFQKELKNKVEEQTLELREGKKKLKESYIQTVSALGEAVDAKDRYTSGHSKRVAEYAKIIAEKMGKSLEEQEIVYRAGLLHDVGKIRIPNEIINKKGRLTDEEYNLIKIHPVTGYHILGSIPDHQTVAIAAKFHHERYDGNGYPNGLSGENIPELARILAVADAYDAMTSNRSYRNGMSQDIVRKEIENGKGTQFDPYIADIMLEIIEEDKTYQMKQTETINHDILIISNSNEIEDQLKGVVDEENIYEFKTINYNDNILETLESTSIEMIILDSPTNENNYKLLNNYQSIKDSYRIPIVLLCNKDSLPNLLSNTYFKYDDYVTKPVKPLMLKEIIYNLTKKY